MKKENMIFRLKLEITELVTEMVNKLPESLFISDSTTFLDPSMGGGQFVQAIESRLRKHGHSDDNIKNRVFGVEKRILRVNYAVNSRKLVGSYTVDTKDIPDIFMNMKFDAIVGNPPYQKRVGPEEAKKTTNLTKAIWQIFVENSIKSLKDGGYLCLVHPPGWRNVYGRYEDVGDLIKSKDLQYLEMHSESDGVKTFSAGIPYDWYLLKNSLYSGNTEVKFQDGVVKKININSIPFIPSGAYDKIVDLLAKKGEPTVEILRDYDYGTQAAHTSREKSKKFKYPLVYTVNKGDVLNLWYSSEKKGHFGIPKVIWSNGKASGFIVDKNGDYGLMEFAYAVIDSPKNLDSIKKALESDDFKKLILDSTSTGTINRKVLALFRKDFWKDFV